jgi:glucose uptake protein GlcU
MRNSNVPRFVVLILICLIGISTQLLLALKFQSYRAGALVLLAFAVVAVLIYCLMPAATSEKRRLANKSQREITRPIRRLAYLYMFGFVVFIVSGQYKMLPGWQGLLCAVPGLIIIVYALWSARRIEQIPVDEWKKRIE